ncbi:hypothetical protein O6H91_22G017100 [Diphasiastrum complanatum]|uniref:Uncharacterized protein n=1 Tax=Diphasiastrum complanatum TaxID=34168 RepID=A0ACC2AD84_DIPCM|nr:hypothetical protein O6H91_22G017100 [Diphasiastrum complanatum]
MAFTVQIDAEAAAPTSFPWRQMIWVPGEWRETNPSDFLPKVLPLAFENRQLEESVSRHQQRLKSTIKHEFLAWKREEPGNDSYDWDAHKRFLEIDVKQMRGVYGLDNTTVDDQTVEEVLALDALVVISILIMYFGLIVRLTQRFYNPVFCHFGLRSSKHHILRDLFLLEQQLPVPLLHKTLSTIICGTEEAISDQLKIVLTQLLFWIYPFRKPAFQDLSQHERGNELTLAINHSLDKLLEYHHLLECLHQVICTGTQEQRLPLLISSYLRPDIGVFSTHQVPPVSELRKAGITIISGAGTIDKARFEGAILNLPQLSVYDNTASILRNLAAFEILFYQDPLYLCPYLVLLGNLAQTKQDVQLLIKNDVIVNCLGSESQMKKMLNGLCRNMPVSLRGTLEWHMMLSDIQEHYKNERHTLLNEFRQTYCSKPWVIASTTAAVFLLSMSFLQTLYTTLSFYYTF